MFSSRKISIFINLFCMFEYFSTSADCVDELIFKAPIKRMKMSEFISAPEAAKKWGKWGISERRVQKLCAENRIPVWGNSAVCG